MFRYLLTAVLGLAVFSAFADTNNTKSQYLPTTGQAVPATVILQSSDGITAKPIDASNPLQVTGSVTSTSGPLPAGTNVIGKVGIDQTTPGVTNGVFSTAQSPTYWASSIGYSPVATATDMSCVIGSATKTVTVTNAVMYVNSTTSATQSLYIIKRTTANSGGTPTTLTPTLYDSADGSATATAVTYAANPTTGTGTTIRYNQITSPVVASPAVAFSLATFSANGSTITYQKNIVLRGTGEALCFNYNGAALAGTLLTVAFEWEWTEK